MKLNDNETFSKKGSYQMKGSSVLIVDDGEMSDEHDQHVRE